MLLCTQISSITAWGSVCKTKLQCLKKIQKRIVRTICGTDRIAPSEPLLNSSGLLNIDGFFSYICGLYVYTFLNSEYNVLNYQNEPCNTRTAQPNLLEVPTINLVIADRPSDTLESLNTRIEHRIQNPLRRTSEHIAIIYFPAFT